MAIRYDKDFNREIQRVVKNFNSKVKRLEQIENPFAPEQIKISELKEVYNDRRQLKRKLNQLRKFSERGAEEVLTTPGGVQITKWAYETERADYTMIKRRLTKQARIETAQVQSPFLKSEKLQNTQDRLDEMKKSFKDLTPHEYEFTKGIVQKEIKTGYYEEIFKINLIRKFETVIREKGYPEDIVVRLQRFSGEELLKMYKEVQGLSTIMEFSDTLGMKKVTQLKSKAHKGATLDKTDFDAIVEQFVNNLSIYEKAYKK